MEKRPNDALFEFFDKAANFALANLFWIVLSIPLITLPAATAGLFATMCRLVRGQNVEVFRDFSEGVRDYWRKATIIGLIDAMVVGLVVANFSIFRLVQAPDLIMLLSQSMTVFVGLTAAMTNVYIWPLLVTFDELPVRRLIETALRFTFADPLWSFVVLILAAMPFVLTLFFLPGVLLMMAAVSASALIVSWGAWRVIRRYIATESTPAEDNQNTTEG